MWRVEGVMEPYGLVKLFQSKVTGRCGSIVTVDTVDGESSALLTVLPRIEELLAE